MQVGILGSGAIALGIASYLGLNGHAVNMWRPRNKTQLLEASDLNISASGAFSNTTNARLFNSCELMAANSDVLIVAISAQGYKAVLDELATCVSDGQSIIVCSHLSFAALYLSKLLSRRKINLPIIAWSTTPLTARQVDVNNVRIGALRPIVEFSTIPSSGISYAQEICENIFGPRFKAVDSLMSILLGNVNPLCHAAIALMNFTRIELGENWSQANNITPGVGRLIEALDLERLSLAKAFELSLPTVRDFFAMSYGMPKNSVFNLNEARGKSGPGTAGPISVDTRYVKEDIPFGLVPTLALGKIANILMPLHCSSVVVFNSIYSEDFFEIDPMLKYLNIKSLNAKDLICICHNGY